MKSVRYFFEYIIIKLLFFIFSLIGYSRASNIGEKIGKLFGPLIRDNKKIIHNLKNVGFCYYKMITNEILPIHSDDD